MTSLTRLTKSERLFFQSVGSFLSLLHLAALKDLVIRSELPSPEVLHKSSILLDMVRAGREKSKHSAGDRIGKLKRQRRRQRQTREI